MCTWIDDGDGTFEEESRRRNQDALSASNGLARLICVPTLQSSITKGWRDVAGEGDGDGGWWMGNGDGGAGWVGKERKRNAFQRRWRSADSKTGCIRCSLAREKAI